VQLIETNQLDAFSVRKGKFLKYKNQYFFYKKIGKIEMDRSLMNESIKESLINQKNHHVVVVVLKNKKRYYLKIGSIPWE